LSVRWLPWPLLEPGVDNGGANAEKHRSNLVRRHAVRYANSREDETVKSYNVSEVAVWCPDWSMMRAAPRAWFRRHVDTGVLEHLCPCHCLAVEEVGRAGAVECGGLARAPSGRDGTVRHRRLCNDR
jgi:hypothetical protein